MRDLVDAGLIAAEQIPGLERVAARYAVAITPAMAELAEEAAVARQFVPDVRELDTVAAESADPIGDEAHSPVKGVVHRYPDRVLLKLTHACAVYCRFCFRREVVGPGARGLTPAEQDAAFDYIAARPQIWEVILTGGDPMVLSPRRLRAALQRLAAIDHVKIVRLHTRVPVVDPQAVTAELVDALRETGLTTYVAVHANHAAELTAEARAACGRLADAGVPLIGQTVLLKGVNDEAQALEELFRAMVETRIKPYYLHQADLAPGTAHFRTSIEEGQALMRSLRGRVSGLCQPTYVLDVPGGYGKSPVGPSYLCGEEDGAILVADPAGGVHRYPPEAG